ncbi:hypothetical protein [Zavarzinia sp. CC-PAN008]|uniref:hypothetical protein n=1 Tax=Zavarzinia sp. CC-PAN008 TaxID=3243332 RepID=UPI003F7483CB
MTFASEAGPRRARLRTSPNPRAGIDYLVQHGAVAGALHLDLTYVPDGAVLQAGAFADWAAAVLEKGGQEKGEQAAGDPGLEALAAVLLDDLDDVLLPRYLDLAVAQGAHRVRFILRQPRWDNPALLALIGCP